MKNRNMSGCTFDDLNVSGWRVHKVDLAGSRVDEADLASIADARLDGPTIDGIAVVNRLAYWLAGDRAKDA